MTGEEAEWVLVGGAIPLPELQGSAGPGRQACALLPAEQGVKSEGEREERPGGWAEAAVPLPAKPLCLPWPPGELLEEENPKGLQTALCLWNPPGSRELFVGL